jgi:hypothetical protein
MTSATESPVAPKLSWAIPPALEALIALDAAPRAEAINNLLKTTHPAARVRVPAAPAPAAPSGTSPYPSH